MPKSFVYMYYLTPLSPEQSRQWHCPLSEEKTTLLRRALGKLNWVAGMTWPGIYFCLWDKHKNQECNHHRYNLGE